MDSHPVGQTVKSPLSRGGNQFSQRRLRNFDSKIVPSVRHWCMSVAQSVDTAKTRTGRPDTEQVRRGVV